MPILSRLTYACPECSHVDGAMNRIGEKPLLWFFIAVFLPTCLISWARQFHGELPD